MEKTSTNRTGFSYTGTSQASITKKELNELIGKKAYELWEKRGRKSGHSNEDWLEAERIIRQKYF